MRSLDDELEDLTELDAYRVQSAAWRDLGRTELATRAEWDELDAPLSEYSLTIRALLAHRGEQHADTARAILEREFSKVTIEQAFAAKPDDMPILRAARIMYALMSGPSSPFNRLAMWCYYRIVREFHSAHAPEWITGGARAGETASPTAYATGECVRAVTALGDVLERMASMLSTLAAITEEWQELQDSAESPSAWKAIEAQRIAHQLLATLEPHRANDALRPPFPQHRSGSVDFENGASVIESVLAAEASLLTIVEGAAEEIREALVQIGESRVQECKKLKDSAVHTISAHEVAVGAVNRAIQTTVDAAAACKAGGMAADRLRSVSAVLRESALRTRRVVRPAVAYLSRVIDHELAAASSDDSAHCDVPELAFAASSYGAASGLWHDERLRRAAGVLINRISERGHFPFGRPLRPSQYGYKAHAIGSEALRAFSELLEHVPGIEVEPRVVKRMMMYFHDAAVDEQPGLWRQDDAPQSQPPQRWSTAFAVISLDRVNRMLDHKINDRILKHFSWRKVVGLGLEDLFYPDYGLVHHKIVQRESLAIILERMRAHVAGIPRMYDQRDPVYSLILHGPGGTGKTTMVEALARSAGVPLVEVTPSDIVIGGVDAVERRTRAVFKALSLLTRVVILFDEFDPILQARDPQANSPASVFSFLTPGMLPKLKTLHDAAKKRSSAYILSTNLVGKLDTAAIREGRFDVRAGVYPPDLLSRTGRLHRVLKRYEGRQSVVPVRHDGQQMRLAAYEVSLDSTVSAKKEQAPTVPRRDRVRAMLMKTRGMSMNTLGRPGWYTAPVDEARSDEDMFAYILGKSSSIQCRPIDDKPRINGSGSEAMREWQEWAWVEAWDAIATKKETLDAALAAPPPLPKPQRTDKVDLDTAAAHCDTCRQMADSLVAHSLTPPRDKRARRTQPTVLSDP